MMTTYETALRLKQAGFPQPKPEVHQFWYGLIAQWDELLCLVGRWGQPGQKTLFSDRYRNEHTYESIKKWGTFAPSATDIMQVLGQDYVLWFDDSPKVMKWCCAKTSSTIHEASAPILHENAAEAAAAAFLNLKSIVEP